VIEQPTGTGDDDLDAAFEFLDLRIDIDTAIDGDAAQASLGSEFADGGMNLFCQLAGRCNDQGANLAAWP